MAATTTSVEVAQGTAGMMMMMTSMSHEVVDRVEPLSRVVGAQVEQQMISQLRGPLWPSKAGDNAASARPGRIGLASLSHRTSGHLDKLSRYKGTHDEVRVIRDSTGTFDGPGHMAEAACIQVARL